MKAAIPSVDGTIVDNNSNNTANGVGGTNAGNTTTAGDSANAGNATSAGGAATGDTNNVILWLAVMLFAVMGIAGAFVLKRKLKS